MKKVLIIDDDKAVRDVFGRACTNNGFDVFEAENGKEGETVFKTHYPDIIILDIIMPEQEGIETIINFMNIDRNIKIIAVSGGGFGNASNYLNDALQLGATAVFEKPINTDELINKIKLILNQ